MMEYIPNMRVFRVGFKGATNYRGNRVIIRDLVNDKSRTVDWSYKIGGDTKNQAQAFFKKKGIKIKGVGYDRNYYYFFTDNFETMI